MKTDVSPDFEKRSNSSKNQENVRKRKNYYAKFLELMARKTDSEKRIQVFGTDPFK